MKTGECHSIVTLHSRLAEIDGAMDHAKERLRYNINKEIGNVLEAYSKKEVVIVLGPITSEPARWHWPNDAIEYKIGFTALLLNWQEAEVGDCVHMSSIDYELIDGNYARFPQGDVFAWEDKWWRRIE